MKPHQMSFGPAMNPSSEMDCQDNLSDTRPLL